MNVDGTNPISLTHQEEIDGRPAWSPDGTHIVFVSYRDGTGNIYLMKADGTNITRLTDTTSQHSNPAWSPDGIHIAFTSGNINTAEIGIIKTDGTGFRLLTDNDVVDQLPTWSPDGTQIAFDCERPPSMHHDICIMNADGSEVVRLMNDAPPDICPTWSPDGTRIAFLSSRHDTNDVHNLGIYLMREDGSGITPLTTFPRNRVLDCPSWSPDGKRLIFSMLSSNGRGKELYSINADGSDLTMLTDNTVDDWDPDWSP
jgi:Tol biopolymer transport system component